MAREAARQALALTQALTERNAGLWQDDLIVAHLTSGHTRESQRDHAGAEVEYRAALDLSQQLVERHTGEDRRQLADAQLFVVKCYAYLAGLAAKRPDHRASERWARAAAELARSWHTELPDSAPWGVALVAACDRLGTALLARGDRAGAEREFRQSLATADRLCRDEPDDPDKRWNAVMARIRLGSVLKEQGRLEEALAEYRPAVAMGEALLQRDAHNERIIHDLTLARQMIAEILESAGRLEEALHELAQMRELCDALSPESPDRVHMRSAHVWRTGAVLEQLGRRADALQVYREYLDRLAEPPALESNRAFLDGERAVAHGQLGTTLAQSGELVSALQHFREANRVCEMFVQRGGPQADAWRENLAVGLRSTASVLERMGRDRDAQETFRESLEIRRGLLGSEAADAERSRLADDFRRLGDGYTRNGDLGSALQAYEVCIALEEQRVERAPTDPAPRLALATARVAAGHGHLRAAQTADALASFRKAVEALQPLAGEGAEDRTQYELSVALEGVGECLNRLGRHEESLAAHSQALSLRNRLSERAPDNAALTTAVIYSLFNVAAQLHRLGRREQALGYAERCERKIESAMRDGVAVEPALVDALRDLRSELASS